MITISLTGRIPSKKNSRQTDTRTGRTFPSDSYKAWHRHAMMQLMMQKAPRKEIVADGILVTLYFGDKRRSDITNKTESVMDLLVDYGVLKDDSWDCTGRMVLVPVYEKGRWGAEIQISEFEEVAA